MPTCALLERWYRLGSCSGLTYKQRLQLLADAARCGDINALRRLSRSTGCLLNEEVFRAAARAGQEGVCEWLMQQDCPVEDDGAWVLAVAAEAGHTQLCEKLHDAGFSLVHNAGQLAARAGQAGVLDWLREQLPLDRHSSARGFSRGPAG